MSLDQPVGHIIQLRLYPIRRLWSLGSGWAAVSGGLAVAGFVLSPEFLLSLFLVWLLADPVLGTVWDLGVGGTSSAGQMGIWRRLLSPRLPDAARPIGLLPYTKTGSFGHQLAQKLGRLSHWWHNTLWPEAGREFATLVAAIGFALLLGAVLGRDVLVLVLLSISLSWLALLAQKEDTIGISDRQSSGLKGISTLWHALGEFCVPWLVGAIAMGSPSWAVFAYGACYGIAYFGLIRYIHDFRLIGFSQGTAVLLLAGLRHPLAAATTAILLMPQWGLHVWRNYIRTRTGAQSGTKSRDILAASRVYLWGLQPFIILSMLIGALAIAS